MHYTRCSCHVTAVMHNLINYSCHYDACVIYSETFRNNHEASSCIIARLKYLLILMLPQLPLLYLTCFTSNNSPRFFFCIKIPCVRYTLEQ